jgi:hypothetical protein
MRPGSLNALVSGDDQLRAFKGVTNLAGKLGGRIIFPADQSYASLGTQAVNGTGAAFRVKQLLMAIGAGQVNFDGAAIATFVASSTLSYSKESGGAYAAPIYQAGRAQPSAPLIFAKDNPSAGRDPMTGGISVVIWRVSDKDGQPSLMSLPSNVLTLSGQSVIVQMPAADSNGQTHWGIGVPRIGFDELGIFYELPTTLGGEVAESALITIDGITRAVEISWTNGALQGQNVAPDKAFPPPAGQFAGVINDTLFVDADGIIYVGDPGFIGSFPPSNAIFTNEPAVHYLRLGANAFGRFGKHSVGVLSYVGGSPALEYQEIIPNLGINLPQNVAIGGGGRLLMFMNRPCALDGSLEPDFEYAKKVLPDFDGWDAQDATKPVVPAYDPLGLYDVWCYQKKVMAKYVPSGKWCSPVDLTGLVNGNVMSAIIIPTATGQKLYLCCVDGATLKLYQYDAGTGSVMTVQTDDTPASYGDTVSEVFVQGRADTVANNVTVKLIKNFDDAHPVTIFNAAPSLTGSQDFCRKFPNILNVKHQAMLVTLQSAGGDAGFDLIETYGSRLHGS